MGVCQYCGQNAGLLKKKHKECEAKHHDDMLQIELRTRDAIVHNMDFQKLQAEISDLSKLSFVQSNETEQAILKGWSGAVEEFFEDGVLSQQEEDRVETFKSFFGYTQDDLNHDNSYTKVVQGTVLRDILEGNLPARVRLEGNIPFNLQKSEQIIWLFNDVHYYEEKTKTHYEGGHHGFSVRIAKGVYYRAGAFKGHPVQTSQIVQLDSGMLAVTNKHVYFAGDNRKSFRIKYDKVVSFTPYDEGIGLQRDAATAKPQIFVTGEGWFTYNLITNMAQFEPATSD